VTDKTKETDARILIDDQLRQAGWDPADKTQVLTEQSVPVAVAPITSCWTRTVVLSQ